MRFAACLICLSTLSSGMALAQEPDYRDDRSNADAIVRSYYNAINRKEYARAWSYFGEQKPSANFEAFAAGFVDTEAVEVETGPASEEGAAGSVYSQIPVAIQAVSAGGEAKVFSGCFEARLVQPGVQGDGFQSLHLVSAHLEPSAEPLATALPERCGDGPAAVVQSDPVLEQVRALFAAVPRERCPGGNGTEEQPQTHALRYRLASDQEGDPEREARLFGFLCNQGAYNSSYVYFLAEQGMATQQLSFAVPELDIRYRDDDSQSDVESLRIHGFTTASELINASYDPATHSIVAAEKWRGPGDASAAGTWLFRDGRFTLVRYEVDASYDGVVNPETVLDYDSAP